MALPPFPIDDEVLNLLEDSMKAVYEVDADGTHHVVGADFTVNQLLDFYSGYDPDAVVNEEYYGPLYHIHDVVKALIEEVRRLRNE